jgi:hypothetical protein
MDVMTNPEPEAVAGIGSVALDAALSELEDLGAALSQDDHGVPCGIVIGSPEWLVLQKVKDIAAQLQIARERGETL